MFSNESIDRRMVPHGTEANNTTIHSIAKSIEQQEFTRDIAKRWLPFVEAAHIAMANAFVAQNIVPGVTLAPHIDRLRRALDSQETAAFACMLAAAESAPCCSGEEPPEPTPEQQDRAEEDLLREALYPFYARAELREFVRKAVAQ
jgi:hypothetical protein